MIFSTTVNLPCFYANKCVFAHRQKYISSVLCDNVEAVNEKPIHILIIQNYNHPHSTIVQSPVEQRAGAASPAQSRRYWLRSNDSVFCCCNDTDATGAGNDYDATKMCYT